MEDSREIFYSVTERESGQEDWSEFVLEEIESLQVRDTNLHLDDGGWDISLTNRECCLF
jgi:hypothetical protein